MSGSVDGTDYADYEYQKVSLVQPAAEAGNDFPRESVVKANIEPLEDIGGLSNNEIAELVAFRLEIGFDGDDAATEGDQNVGGTHFITGALGANITDDALPVEGGTIVGDVETVSGTSSSPAQATSKSDDAVFEVYQAEASLPFDDQTNNTGGGAFFQSHLHDRNYRDSVGRGPVIDQNDDLTIVQRVKSNDAVITPIVSVTVHCIWDVAETDDAGRRFAVPTDD